MSSHPPAAASARSARRYIVLAALACGISLLLLPAHGTPDVDQYWVRWIASIETSGLREAYRLSASDYPPLAFLILGAVAAIGNAIGATPHVVLKVSLWVFLTGAVVLFHWIGRRPLLTVVFYGSLILNSVGLGYLDIYFVPPLLTALWAMHERRFGLALLFYCVACLVKFQPAIIAPAVLVYFQRTGHLRFRVVAPSLALVLVVAAIWGTAIFGALGRATEHRYLSAQALNFNWLLAYGINVFALNGSPWRAPNMIAPPVVLAALRILFVCGYGAALMTNRPASFGSFLRTAIVGYAAYFGFAPGVHENHAMVLLVLLAVSTAYTQTQVWEFVAVAILTNVNLFAFDGLRGAGPSGPPAIWLLVEILAAAVSTAMMVYLVVRNTRQRQAV